MCRDLTSVLQRTVAPLESHYDRLHFFFVRRLRVMGNVETDWPWLGKSLV